MKKSILATLLMGLLLLPLIGCNSSTPEEKVSAPSIAKDNDSPAAKAAVGIPPPDSGMPPPGGGGGLGLKGKK